MNIVVTGGAGFIGSAVVRLLQRDNHSIMVFDNLSSGARTNVPDGVKFTFGDIRDFECLFKCIQGADIVIHLAAFVSVAQSFTEPKLCWDINVSGTRNVLDAAWRAGCKRVVLASTAAVYGSKVSIPVAETALLQPQSPYAYSKWQNEVDARYYSEYLGIESLCLRFFNVYGPLQRPDSSYSGVISVAARKILDRDVFTIYGTGEQSRDFIYVNDVASAIEAAVLVSATDLMAVNVGTGNGTTVNEIVSLIGNLTGIAPLTVQAKPRKGDILHSVADNSRLRNVLNFAPSTPLGVGLADTLRWMESPNEIL